MHSHNYNGISFLALYTVYSYTHSITFVKHYQAQKR